MSTQLESIPPQADPSAESTTRSQRRMLARLIRSPLGLASLIWLAVLVLVCVFAPVLPLSDPLSQQLLSALHLPSAAHPLGTDSLGRDILSRIAWGGRDALLGALEAVAVALVIGVPLGVIAGYAGGWFDQVAGRFADVLFALPALIILLSLAAVAGTSTSVSMASLGVIYSASYLRLARASTRAVRNELYVDAARVSGISRASIVFGNVLPNTVGPLVIQSTLTFGAALLIQASLGFLGLGPPPPAPSWGAMTSEASMYLVQQPWLMVPSGSILILTILAVNLIGDELRDEGTTAVKSSVLKRAASTRPVEQAARQAVEADHDGVVLRVENLTVSFDPDGSPQANVVDHVSLTVSRGETLGLVGESGSGKTMTALAVLNLLPYPGAITEGRIIFEGTDLVGLSEKDMSRIRGRRIGMVSQEPMIALDPSFTVRSQLVAPLRRHKQLSRADARREAISLLKLVGILDPDVVLRKYPHELSGGMAQRVAIAIALSADPALLIADEPTTALDVTVQAGILDLLRSLQLRLGMAVILVTHDLGVVADSCSRAVVMQQGRIVESAPVDDLFERPQQRYTQQLLAATPSLIEMGGDHEPAA